MMVFLFLTALIVYFGVNKGIERFSKVSIPVLFVLIVIIAVYSMTLPGAGDGVRYLVKPDFSKLTPDAYAAALGQSFFSLSLGVGTMLTYASYVRKDENILLSGTGTAFFDLLFAILAGFAVMPAVFAAGITPSSGPGLVFETLPFIFAKMGSAAGFMSAAASIVFFLTILVAALTSSISMMEVGVAYLVEERHVSRHRATLGIFFFSFAAGILCSLSFGPLAGVKIAGNSIFDFLDKLCSNWLLTLGALFFCLFVGWKMDKSAVRDELTNGGSRTFNARVFPVIYFLVRYIAPAAILLVFLSGVVG
jgi:NSS family neurotransmitter:Na+ symporter